MSANPELIEATRKFQKELNAGSVSLLLLGLLSRQPSSMYGYEIAKKLETLAAGQLPMNQGALYPVLRALEKAGLLTSSVEPSVSGPPRKYYSITRTGRKALAEWRKAWENTRNFVDATLDS